MKVHPNHQKPVCNPSVLVDFCWYYRVNGQEIHNYFEASPLDAFVEADPGKPAKTAPVKVGHFVARSRLSQDHIPVSGNQDFIKSVKLMF